MKMPLVFQRDGHFAAVGRERIAIGEFLDIVGDESHGTVGETQLDATTMQRTSRIEASSVESDVRNDMVGGLVPLSRTYHRSQSDRRS